MLNESENNLIFKIREVKKYIDNECEECKEISSCDKNCMWYGFINSIAPILNKADELNGIRPERNGYDSLF
jgi:radical SAM protein with 4Fe4S-binding SPASM domain